MKKLLNLVLTIAIIHSMIFVTGQTPQVMNYQAVARNASGASLPNQHVSLRLSIHNVLISGAIVYQETDTATTNQFGLFTTLIGNGSVTVGTFAGINWATGNKYLEVELDPTGGSNFSSMGTTQLVSVPYALYAGNANGFTHAIGELYQGGIIVGVWQVNGVEHGLIASLTDVSYSAAYSNDTTVIGATAESLDNGSANTTAIIGQVGQTSSAALLCQNYTGGGYTDWYLPSVWELNQCYSAVLIVNTILGDTNGFLCRGYWSSTEYYTGVVWAESFCTGTTSYYNKSNTYSIRAVRRY